MATLAGRQSDIKSMLSALIELDFDAIAAYSVAIEKVGALELKKGFEGFRADHQRHVRELSHWLQRLGGRPPEGADIKAVLTKGKVYIGSLASDRGILLAMKSNENDTNRAYDNAISNDVTTPELITLLELNLSDERRHRQWIEDRLTELKTEKRHRQEQQRVM
jgi:uncharacterized protein (TIGR02284 family)